MEAGIVGSPVTIDSLLGYDKTITDTTGFKRGGYKPRKNIQKPGAKVIPINRVETKLEKSQKKSRERWENELQKAK